MIELNKLTAEELIDRLSQLRALKIELKLLERRVQKLERVVERRKNMVEKMIDGGESWEDISRFIEPVLDAYLSSKRFAMEYLEEYRQLTQFIFSLGNSKIRRILTARYIDGLTWQAIAFTIGEYDEQVPRRLHNHFIQAYINTKSNVCGNCMKSD